MGTHWEVTIWDAISESELSNLKSEILRLSSQFDRAYSRFNKSSLVWKLTAATGNVNVPGDLVSMLRIYQQFYEPSGKQLNPLIGFTLSDLGYDDRYSLRERQEIRKTPDFHEALSIIDDTTIALEMPALIDVGALGKGFFVDKLFHLLTDAGFKHILVNGSGDIRYKGPVPIRLGLEDPHDETKVIGVFDLSTGAFAASGTNRRAWRDRHHIIEPKKHSPSSGSIASWVHAPTAAHADALATALLLSEPEPLLETTEFSFCLMNDQRKIKHSADFSAELFVK